VKGDVLAFLRTRRILLQALGALRVNRDYSSHLQTAPQPIMYYTTNPTIYVLPPTENTDLDASTHGKGV
jgi:hypothetical protein